MNKLIKSKEAAELLGISKGTMHKWEKLGKLNISVRNPLTNYRVYDVEKIKKFMESFK